MDKPTMTASQKKRGRKSEEEVFQQVAMALKNLQKLDWLQECPLGRLPLVIHVADTEYTRTIFPVGFALKSLRTEAVNQVIQELGEMPNYQKKAESLREYVKGNNVAEISRGLNMSREHVTRYIKPKAISLVARAFLARANESSVNTPPAN
jgi:hypothetical protein